MVVVVVVDGCGGCCCGCCSVGSELAALVGDYLCQGVMVVVVVVDGCGGCCCGCCSVGSELAALVGDYLCQGVPGDTEVARGPGGGPGGGLPHLTALFLNASRRLHSELNSLLQGLEALGRLFEPPPGTPLGRAAKRGSPPPSAQEGDLELLLLKLASLRDVFSGTEKKVLRYLQDPAPPPPLGPAPVKTVRRFRLIPIQTFEVQPTATTTTTTTTTTIGVRHEGAAMTPRRLCQARCIRKSRDQVPWVDCCARLGA
ncbi:uncharacterized protein LOC144740436 [Lampetra planeri]